MDIEEAKRQIAEISKGVESALPKGISFVLLMQHPVGLVGLTPSSTENGVELAQKWLVAHSAMPDATMFRAFADDVSEAVGLKGNVSLGDVVARCRELGKLVQ